jgi:ribonuclease HI
MATYIYIQMVPQGNPGNGGYGVVMEWVGKTYKEFLRGF